MLPLVMSVAGLGLKHAGPVPVGRGHDSVGFKCSIGGDDDEMKERQNGF